ncbi:MAG: hypothetical protein AAGA48_34015 [Myxococcota bacterium]
MVFYGPLLLACGASEPPLWRVREAFDVPPPPGAVALDLGPVKVKRVFQPGQRVRLRHGPHTVPVELLDVRSGDEGTILTVYAPANVADAWVLAPNPIQIRIEPD